MMVSRKFCVVLICMLALGGSAQAQTQGDGNKGQSQQNDSQTKQGETTITDTRPGGPPLESQAADKSLAETKVYEPDCRKPKSQPDADLCVQRRVADAAESALHWTQIQTYGALVGLVLVLATLGVTAWTGKAASVAAQAAVDAVGAERAWMSFVELNFSQGAGSLNGVPQSLIYGFDLSIKNTGRSPAIRSAVKREARMINAGAEMPSFDVRTEAEYAAVIGPGVVSSCQTFPIAGQDIADLRAGRKVLGISRSFG